jgi:hypothetical protein
MKLAHRRWHRRIWIVLPAIVGVIFVAALAVRPSPLGKVVPWVAEGSR